MNPEPRKRRHHYVWKYYLQAWAIDEKIHCLNRGKPLFDKLTNVAQERDFYELKILSAEDIAFIKSFVIEQAMPDLRSLHEHALKVYLQAQSAIVFGRSHSEKYPDIGSAAEKLASNITEEWHSAIERGAGDPLRALRAGSTSFYDDRDSCLDFTLFLASQYFRTKAVKTSAIESLQRAAEKADPWRMWNLMAHMFSLNTAWHLFNIRTEHRIELLRNTTSVDFITSDQPVINIAAPLGRESPPTHLKIYYPVSPKLAILLGDGPPGLSISTPPSRVEVGLLNERVAKQARSYIFAKREQDLPSAL